MKASQLIKSLINQKLDELHVALPAKIEKYDHKKLEAEVTLLAKKNLEGEDVVIPPIVRCPVRVLKAGPFVIRPPYQKGDIVQVLFNERALEKLLIDGEVKSINSIRRHSFDDAVVIGGLKIEQQPDLIEDYKEDLLIHNQTTKDKVVIKKDGDIVIESNTNIHLGGDNAGDFAVLLSKLKLLVNQLQTHTHVGNLGGPTSPPTQTFTTDLGSTHVLMINRGENHEKSEKARYFGRNN